jgi:hypothetical protein
VVSKPGQAPGFFLQGSMQQELVKMRVLAYYRGAEEKSFGGRGVPEGAKILVTPQRARELIAMNFAAPILGPAETKPTGPAEKKAHSGTDGSAAPLSSSPAAQASLIPTVPKSPGANAAPAGASSPSRTTSVSSRKRTSSTAATGTTGARGTRMGGGT